MMKKIKITAIKLISVATLCSVTVSAYATEWVRVNTGNFDAKVLDYDQYFYDRTKLITKNNPDEVTYWRLVVFKKPRSYKGKFVKKTLMREKLNCTEHSTKLLSAVHYDMNDQLVDQSMNVQADSEPVIPNTIGDAYEQTMCRLIPPAPPPAPVAPAVPTTSTPNVATPPLNPDATKKDATTKPASPDATPTVSKEASTAVNPNKPADTASQPQQKPTTPVPNNPATGNPPATTSPQPTTAPIPQSTAPRPIAPPPVPLSQRSNIQKVKLQQLIQKVNQTGVSATVNKTTIPPNSQPIVLNPPRPN